MAKKKSLETIKNLVNRYGSAKIMLKLPKSKFKVSKAPKIKVPKVTKSKFKVKD